MIQHVRQITGRIPQPVRHQIRRLLFAGGEDRCPLCGEGVRRWRDHGGGAEIYDRRRVVGGMRRAADRCPICHGKDRTRLMQLFLRDHVGLGRRPVRVLDVAPEYGLHIWIVGQPHVDYTATDLDATRYRHVARFTPADLTALPFGDGDFDVVVCSHVLEHVPDDHAAMREIRRVLAPDGVALLLVPEATDGGPTDEDPSVIDPADRQQRYGQWDHVRLYAREDFVRRLQAAGMTVESWNPAADDPALAARLSINPAERLHLARPSEETGHA